MFRPAKAASGAANAIAADRTTAAPERIALSASVSDRADATGRAATARRAVLAEAAGLTARSCCALAETANILWACEEVGSVRRCARDPRLGPHPMPLMRGRAASLVIHRRTMSCCWARDYGGRGVSAASAESDFESTAQTDKYPDSQTVSSARKRGSHLDRPVQSLLGAAERRVSPSSKRAPHARRTRARSIGSRRHGDRSSASANMALM